MSSHGKNAIVSKIQDLNLPDLGLVIGLRIVAVDGTIAEGWKHEKIIDRIADQSTRPFFLTFKTVMLFIDCVTRLIFIISIIDMKLLAFVNTLIDVIQ